MIIIGLTGSIASGKSTISNAMARYHIPVFDSDKAVHDLMGANGKAVSAILSDFPDTGTLATGIDRKKLGSHVFGDADALKQLEAILHPKVSMQREGFLKQAQLQRRKAVLLDVPLLFETGTDLLCDVTIMAWAPLWLIKARAMRRPGMTQEKLTHILAQQMPQHQKARLADERIVTGLGHGVMMQQILRLLSKWHLR